MKHLLQIYSYAHEIKAFSLGLVKVVVNGENIISLAIDVSSV